MRRRDSLSAYRGFTLIELMVVVSIMTVVMAIAAPSLVDFVRNRAIVQAATDIASGLQVARAEAVRRNQRIAFALDGPGWTVTAADGSEVSRKSRSEAASTLSIAVNSGGTKATFGGLGGLVDNADGSSALDEITVTQAAAVMPASRARPQRVLISAGGAVRMCDPSVTTVGDVRAC